MRSRLIVGDCLNILSEFPTNSVDLIIGSPPYEDARTYGIDFKLSSFEWVNWMVPRVLEMVRVSKGLVVMVVQGKVRKYRWSATPFLLGARLHELGIHLRIPAIYERDGIPGSGGPDYWKNRYEFCLVCSKGGRLPWSDNTANGQPPKYKPGGAPSSRRKDGTRVRGTYKPPKLANAGNIIHCGPAGGGRIGDRLAHENEAPFPEQLVEPFIKCFCPPGGTVLDPFCGSGTSLSVAKSCKRSHVGIDIRKSQIELSRKRLLTV